MMTSGERLATTRTYQTTSALRGTQHAFSFSWTSMSSSSQWKVTCIWHQLGGGKVSTVTREAKRCKVLRLRPRADGGAAAGCREWSSDAEDSPGNLEIERHDPN